MTYGSFLGLTVMKITYRLKRDNADKTNSLFAGMLNTIA